MNITFRYSLYKTRLNAYFYLLQLLILKNEATGQSLLWENTVISTEI